MHITSFLLALGFVVTAAAASARREEPAYAPPPPTITATPLALAIAGFDRDGDMIVSRAEFDAGVARSFAAGDRNADARMSLTELSIWSETTLGSSGALPGQFDFDKDGDDGISRDEFAGLFAARFAVLDTDKDGVLRRRELISFTANPMATGRGRSTGPAPKK